MGSALRKLAGLVGASQAASDEEVNAAIERELAADPELQKAVIAEIAIAKTFGNPHTVAYAGVSPGVRGFETVPGPRGLTMSVPRDGLAKAATTLSTTVSADDVKARPKKDRVTRSLRKLEKAAKRLKKLRKRAAAPHQIAAAANKVRRRTEKLAKVAKAAKAARGSLAK